MLETPVLTGCLSASDLTCVCCNCQRERTAGNEWRERRPVAGQRVTHGICPHCLWELYPDVASQIVPRPS
jgi:hypothetical protein